MTKTCSEEMWVGVLIVGYEILNLDCKIMNEKSGCGGGSFEASLSKLLYLVVLAFVRTYLAKYFYL